MSEIHNGYQDRAELKQGDWEARKRTVRHAIAMLVLALFMMAPSETKAETCSANMSNMNFGNINVVAGTAVDTAATLTVTCSGFSGANTVCVNFGVGQSGDATSRTMVGPAGATVRYDLYTDAARTDVWGSWVTGYRSPGIEVSAGNGTFNYPVYGRFFASQQSAAWGAYSSTFTVDPVVEYKNAGGNCPKPGSSQTSSSFTVSAYVLPSCKVSASNMNFGSSGIIAANVDATATLTLTCSNGAPYTVSLSNGNTGTSPILRKMVNGANSITYGLYRDAARSAQWGSTIGTNTASGTGNGSLQTMTVYGRVQPQNTPAPGTYTDTIVVTITY